MIARIAQPPIAAWAPASRPLARLESVREKDRIRGGSVSEIEEKGYREMVAAQDDSQVDTWSADLFIDFAKRMGVGTAIEAFCRAAGLDARAFQRTFLVGGGPDHVVGIDTAGALAAPIFELPKAIAGLRRIDPDARAKLIDFLVEQREVMSYTP
jgi:hypothetical protein